MNNDIFPILCEVCSKVERPNSFEEYTEWEQRHAHPHAN